MNTKQLLEFIGHEPTDELIHNIEKHFEVSRKHPSGLKLEAVFTYVAVKHDIELENIKSNVRKREYVIPRHEGCFLACMLGFSTKAIGRFINKDHSTVINARETIRGFMCVNTKYNRELQADLHFLTL